MVTQMHRHLRIFQLFFFDSTFFKTQSVRYTIVHHTPYTTTIAFRVSRVSAIQDCWLSIDEPRLVH